jgi:hypothetical protein
VKKCLLYSVPFALLLGCGDQKTMPFLGQWNGKFEVERVLKGPNTAEDRKRHELKGYIKIVLNKKKYEMVLDGEQQNVSVTGKWTYNGSQLILEPVDAKVETEGKEDGPNPNEKFVDPTELYTAYLKKLTFRLSKDGRSLTGLTTTVAILEGNHRFTKD